MTLVLYAGDTRLGTLAYRDMDWPRYYYYFAPTPEYQAFRQILDHRAGRSFRDFQETLLAAEKLDLRVVDDNGQSQRLLLIFIDANLAVIRRGLIRTPQAEAEIAKWAREPLER